MGNYKNFMISRSPAWLQSQQGQAFLNAKGDSKDALVDRAKESVQARFAKFAPTGALNLIGSERQLPRSTNETDETYASRLQAAWTTWYWAGTPTGLLVAIEAAGYGVAFLATSNGNIHYLDDPGNSLVVDTDPAIGGAWTTDLGAGFWSAFTVILWNGFPWGADPTPNDSSDEANAMRDLVRQWKPGHTVCDKIVVMTDQDVWGFPLDDVWGTGTWGSTAVIWTGVT